MTSFGVCQNSLVNERPLVASGNLRIINNVIEIILSADLDASFTTGDVKTVTFSVMIPKSIGYYKINWDEYVAANDSPAIDHVSYISDGKFVKAETSGTATLVCSSGALSFNDTNITGATDFFDKFDVVYTLTNSTGAELNIQKLMVGIKDELTTEVPINGKYRFEIFTSVVVSGTA
jgi:hypothetical protein